MSDRDETKRWRDCVIICGGLGDRMFPLCAENQKTTLPVMGRPLLYYIVDYWRVHCDRFVFVTGYRSEQVAAFADGLDVTTEVIVEKERKGIAAALLEARGHLAPRFVTVLGDCLCHGSFTFPATLEQGIGYTATDDQGAILRSYSVKIEKGSLLRVEEKPKRAPNNLLGMGVYFFNQTVFDHIEAAPPSTRTGKVEITDVIGRMIASGESLSAVPFVGDYVNVTFPDDLSVADAIIRKHIDAGGAPLSLCR